MTYLYYIMSENSNTTGEGNSNRKKHVITLDYSSIDDELKYTEYVQY